MSRILLLPCNGIGNPLSTVSRYAALRAAELLADDGVEVELVPIGRLLARLPETLDAAQREPVAVIEACSFRCASKVMGELGIDMAAYIYVPQVMHRMGVGSRGLDRKFLGPKGRAIVEETARATADAILALVAGDEAGQPAAEASAEPAVVAGVQGGEAQ